MSYGALVIGSGAAGQQAALDLADSGIQVYLVESAPFLPISSAGSIHHSLNSRYLEIARHPNITLWMNTHIDCVERQGRVFSVELHTQPRYVDLTKCTACGDCIDVCPITVPGTDHQAIFLDGQPGCMAIDRVSTPPCELNCPGNIHVQGYVALAAQGRFQEGIDLIRKAIPFPGICGRVCTHPCEVNCRRNEIDQPVAVRRLKRFLADWELDNNPHQLQIDEVVGSKEQKVAIVGAGPAGMAAAQQLARRGYPVTVFEKLPVIGGMMAIGIPEYRLPFEVITREYQPLRDLGIEIRLNTSIGPGEDLTLDELFEIGYQAVCLAVGAHKSLSLGISGETLPGVIHGIQLLKTINLSQQLDDPFIKADLAGLLPRGDRTRVAVLGGGNTAMDVSRSLRRLGIRDVRLLYRRTRAEMPAMPEEIDDAIQEGVAIDYLVSPLEVLGDTGAGVVGLVCIRNQLGEPDSSGRRRPEPIEGSEFVAEVDLVVLAIGQAPDLNFLGHNPGIGVTRSDRIEIGANNFMTQRPGVFAAGDAVTRDKMVIIEAISMGKQAAVAIEAYLQGDPLPAKGIIPQAIPPHLLELTAEEMKPKPTIPAAKIPLADRQTSFAEMELAFSPEQAISEAGRCLACGPCSECMACVEVCKPGAVIHQQETAFSQLNVDAILMACDPPRHESESPLIGQCVYQADPQNPISGSAIAARVLVDLSPRNQYSQYVTNHRTNAVSSRIGVLVCQCGGEISDVVDTCNVCNQIAKFPDVVHTQALPFSCSNEAAQEISHLVASHQLNTVVLAGCACCALEQVCHSCTYQRVRCKDNLGVFDTHDPEVRFEFINIREQCAWIHRDDPQAATVKAADLVRAAVSSARIKPVRFEALPPNEKSVLVLGGGAAAQYSLSTLMNLQIRADWCEEIPDQVQRIGGQYLVTHEDQVRESLALVLAPEKLDEIPGNLADLAQDGDGPYSGILRETLDPRRSGIVICDPQFDPELCGTAAAARLMAWFGQVDRRKTNPGAIVNSSRCRACSTCVEICEYIAPEIVTARGARTAWIDPALCEGCGTCAAHCPSGAIRTGNLSESQLEATLEGLLA